ncbi:MAG: hypothetical protein R3B07_09740 [Polyangiaceae bacterium]
MIYGGADETLFNPSARYFQDLWSLDLETLTREGAGARHHRAPDWAFLAGDWL